MFWNWWSCEHCLINVDDSISIFPHFVDLPLKFLPLFNDFFFCLVVLFLLPLDFPLLNAVHPIDFGEQSCVYFRLRKLLFDMFASVFEREPSLILQCFACNYPWDPMLLDEFYTKTLPSNEVFVLKDTLSAKFHLLKQWQLLDF